MRQENGQNTAPDNFFFRDLRSSCNDLLEEQGLILRRFGRQLLPLSQLAVLTSTDVPVQPLNTLFTRVASMFDNRAVKRPIDDETESRYLAVSSRGSDLLTALWIDIQVSDSDEYLRLYKRHADRYCLPGHPLYEVSGPGTVFPNYANDQRIILARRMGIAELTTGQKYKALIDQIK